MSKVKVLSNDFLKENLTDALVERGFVSDLDTLEKPGIYYMSHLTANKPSGCPSYAIVIVTAASDLIGTLILALGGIVFSRCHVKGKKDNLIWQRHQSTSV